MRALCLLTTLAFAAAAQAQDVEARFADYDKDGDGRLSREEFPFKRLFDKLDADGDGSLSLEEARALSRRGRGGGEMEVRRDLPYGQLEGVDPKLLSLDVYGPKAEEGSAERRPMLVMIHGGGWATGDKSNRAVVSPKAEHFVERGWLFISVNYRLSPAVKHPAHLNDIAAALAWLHEHGGKLGGDASRMVVMGHSAGAHLAALVATHPKALAAVGLDASAIKGVVALDSGAYDPATELAGEGVPARRRKMLEQAFGEEAEGWADASPTRQVLASAKGRAIAPHLLFWTGSREDAKGAAEKLAAALTAAGIRAEVEHAADRSHATMNSKIGEPEDPYTKRIDAFLEGCIAAPSESAEREAPGE